MMNRTGNLEEVELVGLGKYFFNNNFFRTDFTDAAYYAVPRRTFASFHDQQDYINYHQLLPRVVMVDLCDVTRALIAEKKSPGFSEIDVMELACIVCTFIGDNTVLTGVLWNAVEKKIASAISYQLGIAENDPGMVEPFNMAVAAVFDIATIIGRYLVNANCPIVETESVYGPAKYENGIVALVLKEYPALAADYHKVENESFFPY
jgi:hypothetical protein